MVTKYAYSWQSDRNWTLNWLPSSKVIAKKGMEIFAKNIILIFLANKHLNNYSFDHWLHESVFVCVRGFTFV